MPDFDLDKHINKVGKERAMTDLDRAIADARRHFAGISVSDDTRLILERLYEAASRKPRWTIICGNSVFLYNDPEHYKDKRDELERERMTFTVVPT